LFPKLSDIIGSTTW